MGKKRIAKIGQEQPEKPKTKKKAQKPEKIHFAGLKGGQRLTTVAAEPAAEEKKEEKTVTAKAQKATKAQKKIRVRGQKYRIAKIKIDPTKPYPLNEALVLAKETSFSKFDGSLEAHLVVTKTGIRGEAHLPYFQSKAKKIEVANEATLGKIESGKIDFDILLATPAFMPQLVKYAKVLGPRGLMPNPKAGTIVEDPEKAIEKFQNQTFSFKTEANAPLIHTVFGKVSQKNEELETNLQALLSAIGPKNLKKVVIKAAMGPAVKVDLNTLA